MSPWKKMPHVRPGSRSIALVIGVLLLSIGTGRAIAADAIRLAAALDSITVEDLRQHVDVLTNDSLEGREAGSRGGRAAGIYLGQQFRRLELKGGAPDGGYYQEFDPGCRNVLAFIEGSDPTLKQDLVVLGAHYDHVGFGNKRNSQGPIGQIHHGADDNASGTATILEVAEAFSKLDPPKRSLLLALWDGEESGLNGSKYWLSRPTVSLDHVVMSFNTDMVGRLRQESLEVFGVRTAPGLRRILSQANEGAPLVMSFSWDIKQDSDHYPFFAKNVPFLMLFTGMHEDYHRPSDEARKLNVEGMREVGRLLFQVAYDVADAPAVPRFRPASRNETPEVRRTVEQPPAPLPGRLGIRWTDAKVDAPPNPPKLVVQSVTSGSPAAKAGINVGDRILAYAGRPLEDTDVFRHWIVGAPKEIELLVQRPDAPAPRRVRVTLDGQPLRWGLYWRLDEAEPGCAILTQIAPASPAERAGLQPLDRIYQVAGQDFANGEEFAKRMAEGSGPLEIRYERRGQIHSTTLPAPVE